MAYTTLADIREHGQFIDSDTVDDGILSALIPRAEAWIDDYCQTTFEVSDNSSLRFHAVEHTDGRTLYFHGVHGLYHLASIASVTNGDGTQVQADEYVTLPNNEPPYYGVRLLSSSNKSWTYTDDPEEAISIFGKWGYSETVPQNVQLATILLVLHWYRQESQDKPKDMPKDIYKLLAPYCDLR